MRIGILGGTFDPVHLGHLWIASAAAESLGLDQVRFVPAAQNPLKDRGPVASADQRTAMLRLAIGGDDRFVVDPVEIDRAEAPKAAEGGGPSYMVDTLGQLIADDPQSEWFLIVGGDSVATFDRWRDPQRILSMATLAGVRRGGEGAIDYSPLAGVATAGQLQSAMEHEIAMPAIELSSRDLRRRIASGGSVRYFVPAAVRQLIEAERLYGWGG